MGHQIIRQEAQRAGAKPASMRGTALAPVERATANRSGFGDSGARKGGGGGSTALKVDRDERLKQRKEKRGREGRIKLAAARRKGEAGEELVYGRR